MNIASTKTQINSKLYKINKDNSNKKCILFNTENLQISFKGKTVAQKLAEIIDGDDIRNIMPEYIENKNFKAIRQESADIKDALLTKAVKNDDNLIFQTGGMKLSEIENIKSHICNINSNYEITLILMDVKPETAAKRAVKRFEKTGRFTDPYQVIYDFGTASADNYEKLKNSNIFKHYIKYSNEGNSPKLTEKI